MSWARVLKIKGIKTTLSEILLTHGWELYDYRPPDDDIGGSWGCFWTGIATHADYQDYVLGVYVHERNVKEHSGKPQAESPLPAYDSHLPSPFMVSLPFPEFQATPKGQGWHLEHCGQIVQTGKFPRQCDGDFRNEAALACGRVLDSIENFITGNVIIDTSLPPHPLKIRNKLKKDLPNFPIKKVSMPYEDWFYVVSFAASSDSEAEQLEKTLRLLTWCEVLSDGMLFIHKGQTTTGIRIISEKETA